MPIPDELRAEGADQPATLFPDLYSGAPGEGGQSAQDITGEVLAPLGDAPVLRGPDNEPLPVGPPLPADAGQAAAIESTTPAAARPRRTLQDRIDSLTRRYRQEQGKTSGLEAQVQRLMDTVMAQNQQISKLHGAIRAPSAPQAADSLALGDPAGAQPAQPSGVPFTLDDINQVVAGAIETYDQRARDANRAADAHRAASEISFAEAVEEMPELADQRTRARKLFNSLYASSPLRALPDGPYQVALQVRGLLAAEGGAAQADERKARAGVVAPRPSAVEVPISDTAGLKKEFDALSGEIRRGNPDFGVYRRWRQVRAAIENSRKA